jgi:hypothetical protein
VLTAGADVDHAAPKYWYWLEFIHVCPIAYLPGNIPAPALCAAGRTDRTTVARPTGDFLGTRRDAENLRRNGPALVGSVAKLPLVILAPTLDRPIAADGT